MVVMTQIPGSLRPPESRYLWTDSPRSYITQVLKRLILVLVWSGTTSMRLLSLMEWTLLADECQGWVLLGSLWEEVCLYIHGFFTIKCWLNVAGYSWKTNQYGLTIDTVTAFELVKPDGIVVTVTKTSDPDLFFGLKVRVFSSVNV